MARPRAQGQAMIRTEIAALNACSAEPPVTSHPARVTRAITSTAGTKTPEMRSASRWTAAFSFWASSTRPQHVGQLRVAPDTRGPDHQVDRRPQIVPPTTRSPGLTSTGRDSPVMALRSMADCHRRSPRRRWPPSPPAAPRTGHPPRAGRSGAGVRRPSASSTATSLAPTAASDRRAFPDRRLLSASK